MLASKAYFCNMMVRPTLISRVIQAQDQDQDMRVRFTKMAAQDPLNWNIGSDRGFRFRGKILVPNTIDLKKDILEETHRSRFTVHPGSTKMYKDLKRQYWWEGMK